MGLIVAFAGGYSHHDQYFFRHRQEMVAGEVKAPSLDLANEALLRAHIQAEWLVSTGLALRDNITFTVNTEDDRLPLHDDVEKALHLAPEVQESLRQRLKRILEADWAELEEQGFSWSWVDEVLAEAPKNLTGPLTVGGTCTEPCKRTRRQLYRTSGVCGAKNGKRRKNALRKHPGSRTCWKTAVPPRRKGTSTPIVTWPRRDSYPATGSPPSP